MASQRRQNLKRKRAPFIDGPSCIIPQALSMADNPSVQRAIISTQPPSARLPAKHVTTLLLSLPLAQQIHNLILTSREIEGLRRGWFGGNNIEDSERREKKMRELEEWYDQLRVEVEVELESAWVGAGYLPQKASEIAVGKYPASKKISATGVVANAVPGPSRSVDYYSEEYSVDEELQQGRTSEQQSRQRQERFAKRFKPSSPTRPDLDSNRYHDFTYSVDKELRLQARLQGKKAEKHDDNHNLSRGGSRCVSHKREEEEERYEMPQPISSVAKTPLSMNEKQRLRKWVWKDALRQNREEGSRSLDNCVSPRGSVWFL